MPVPSATTSFNIAFTCLVTSGDMIRRRVGLRRRAPADAAHEVRLHPDAVVPDRGVDGSHLEWGYRDPLSDRDVADGRARPLLEREHEPGTLAGEVDAGRLAEAELVDPAGEALLSELLRERDCADVGGDSRICATVNVWVARPWESWMIRSATWIEYGSVNGVDGLTRPSDRTPVTVTSLKVDPGS